jgi:hypothetical protein
MDNINKLLNNKYFIALAPIILVYYAHLTSVELPPVIVNLFKNDIFKVLFLSSILFVNFKKSPHVSIIVSIIFILTTNYINVSKKKELFANNRPYKNNNSNTKTNKQIKKK